MGKHGKDECIQGGVTLVAEADYADFAPAPCAFLICFNSSFQQGRTYFRVWDNRVEWNAPIAPFLCLTASSSCVVDNVHTIYYDQQPFRSGMCCYCLPFTCCGPPVIYINKPSCCFGLVDISPYTGETLMAAPCDLFGLLWYLVCGPPCYTYLSLPIIGGLKNGQKLIVAFQEAVSAYADKHDLDPKEMAIFEILGATAKDKKLQKKLKKKNNQRLNADSDSDSDANEATEADGLEMTGKNKKGSKKGKGAESPIKVKADKKKKKKVEEEEAEEEEEEEEETQKTPSKKSKKVEESESEPSSHPEEFEVMRAFFKTTCGLSKKHAESAATAAIEKDFHSPRKLAKSWGRNAFKLSELRLDKDDAEEVAGKLNELVSPEDHWVTRDGMPSTQL